MVSSWRKWREHVAFAGEDDQTMTYRKERHCSVLDVEIG